MGDWVVGVSGGMVVGVPVSVHVLPSSSFLGKSAGHQFLSPSSLQQLVAGVLCFYDGC